MPVLFLFPRIDLICVCIFVSISGNSKSGVSSPMFGTNVNDVSDKVILNTKVEKINALDDYHPSF
jgi:hypothetical protein